MTNRNPGRWLLVALAVVGFAFAAPAVSADGDEPMSENETVADEMPVDGETADWTARMDEYMTDHTGPDTVDEKHSHTRVTVGEIVQDGTGDHHIGAEEVADDPHTSTGMNRRGHGC